jgi:hypothetical protein
MIDDYINELDSHLRVSARRRSRILLEVREHLEDALAQGKAGPHPDRAAEHALREFGPARPLALQLNAQSATRSARRAPGAALLAGVLVIVGFLIAVITQPTASSRGSARPAQQVSFFVATIGLQVAVVAGVCMAARVLGRWRCSMMRVDDRQFVRDAAAIFSGALVVAATAWAFTVSLYGHTLTHADHVALVAGVGLMLLGAVASVVACALVVVNPLDDATDAPTTASGFLALPERCVSLAPRHPVSTCAGAAVVAALAAMSHAETTVVAASLWGAIEAAFVIAGFIVLGPRLGLREPRTA